MKSPSKKTCRRFAEHYAGEKSIRFWGEVFALKGTKAGNELYLRACHLRDTENKVLNLLNNLRPGK